MVVPPNSTTPVIKNALRHSLRQQRRDYIRSLTTSERIVLHELLAEKVCARLSRDMVIGSYLAIGSEIDPLPTDRRADGLGCEIAYPWFADRDADMLFRCGANLVSSPFNFLQPDPNAALIQPDVLLVPLVGIDRSGNRIGQGAGHYDRYIATHQVKKSILTIGLAYDIQIVDEIPTDSWDIPLHAIATPDRWINIAG